MKLLSPDAILILTIIVLVSKIESQGQTPKALYYGFFFDVTAKSIKNITDTYLQNCLKSIPTFSDFLQSASSNASVPLNNFYTKPLDPNTQEFDPYYHVTTKFCGGTDCTPYEQRVSNFVNKTFQMQLIGYYFTNRTYGIRVKLTEEQQALFENDGKQQCDSSCTISTLDITFDTRQTNYTLPGIHFESQDMDFKPTNNKAHITIGCAPNISAVTAGTDLMEIIGYENDIVETSRANFTLADGSLGNATVVLYGQWDAFVIYPSVRALANATFEPYFLPGESGAGSLSGCWVKYFWVFVVWKLLGK